MADAFWPENGPDKLEDICIRFLAKNLYIISEQGKTRLPGGGDSVDAGSSSEGGSTDAVDIALKLNVANDFGGGSSVDPEISTCHHMRPGIHLPKSVCDRFLSILFEEEGEPKELTYEKLFIFSNTLATRLSRVDLRFVADHSLVMGLMMLSRQPLTELTMPCVWRCLPIIKQIKTLRSLRLEKEPTTNAVDAFIQGQQSDSMENIHSVGSQVDGTPVFSADEDYYKLTCPNLQRLVLHNLQFRTSQVRDLSFNSMVVSSLVSPLQRLTHLSLSMCRVHAEELTCLSNLTTLVSLNLSNIRINDFSTVLNILRPLRDLQFVLFLQSIKSFNVDNTLNTNYCC